MDKGLIIKLARDIVQQATSLKDKHTDTRGAPVNYAAIFCQSQPEYDDLLETARLIGKVVKDTATGPLFQIEPIETVADKLQLLKIRQPDPSRPEAGDADFTIADYATFKGTYLQKFGFKLIERPGMEMIELMDPSFNVRAYFSHPPMDEQLGLTKS